MNPVDRFNCVLRYSSLPQELQAQVRLPWLANVLEWHALRDAALVLVDIRDNTTLVENRAALPIAVTSTCDKVKMFALSFFSLPLRMLFWVCNSHFQLRQNLPVNRGAPAAPVQPLDLNELVEDVLNGRITQERALEIIEERVPEGQKEEVRGLLLAAPGEPLADTQGRTALIQDQDLEYEEALRADRARLGEREKAIKNTLQIHFDSLYQEEKEPLMQELKEVINQGFADFREAKPLLEFFEGECIPLCAIRETIDFLREKDPQKDFLAIRGYLRNRPTYIQNNYLDRR